MKNRRLIIGVLIFVAIFIAIHLCSSYYSTKTYTITVTDKAVTNAGNGSQYLIFTKLEDGETRTFIVKDSLFKWRWNSSDVYADIEIGKTYEIEAIGWRIPPLSKYENIIKFN